MPQKFNALIIGAGKIGAFFDLPKDKKILTHAHAYYNHPHFEIVGFVDSNYSQAQKASKIWGGRAYKNLSEAFVDKKIDVVSICVPDELHYSFLKELEKYSILGGITEKPLTTSLKHSKEIINSRFYKKLPFVLNYTRRFLPQFQEIQSKIISGKYGKFLGGNINYGKGLLHNGSHLIDLLNYFGLSVKKFSTFWGINDFYKEDHSYSAILETESKAKINLNVFPAFYYRIFEMDLIFEKGRIKIIKDGFEIEEYAVENDDVFKGYKVLRLVKIYHTDLKSSLSYTLENLYGSIVYGEKVLCTLYDGYEVQNTCEKIKNRKSNANGSKK